MGIEEKKLSVEELNNLQEDDLLFITYPGRMGDIYGCSFVIKKNDKITFYRIENIYEFKGNIYAQFPKWNEALKNYSEKKETEKYKIIYMGFGNLLGIDNSVFDSFKPLAEEKMKNISENYENDLKFGAACYTYWKEIVNNMFNK
ncbi:MAG: hypothetical protein IJG68_03865 [Bacilli bacterium]|nr:hypothetical protein [Bacilli bacterium]